MSRLKATIDLDNHLLRTDTAQIPIRLKQNKTTEAYVIEPQTKTVVALPVNIEKGEFFCKEIQVLRNVVITEGLYQASDNVSFMEVVNSGEEQQILYLDSPLVVYKWPKEVFAEINVITDVSNNHPTDKIDFTQLRIEHLNKEEESELKRLFLKFPKIFHNGSDKLSFSNQIKHDISTTDDIPIYVRPFKYAQCEKIEIMKQIDKLLEQDIIKNSHSPWSAPVWLVPKKMDASGESKWRMVVDFRKLNEKTVKDKYPMPAINDVLDKIGRAKYFSALDLASGYHQIEMARKDRPKTAFTAVGGHYEFTRMPFGLTNAPATFQRVMDNVLKELIGKCCLVYLDDIVVFSSSLQEHMTHLKLVFQKLAQANLKLQIEKSEFLKKEIEYLGHIVTAEGIKPNPKKIEAIKKFPIPQTKKEIKSFLGLLGYYRKFIRDFARITKPLTRQLKGKLKTIKNLLTLSRRVKRSYATIQCCNTLTSTENSF